MAFGAISIEKRSIDHRQEWGRFHSLDSLDHRQAHVDAQDGVVRTLHWCAANAVVAVAQNFNAQLVVFLKIKTNEKRIEKKTKQLILE